MIGGVFRKHVGGSHVGITLTEHRRAGGGETEEVDPERRVDRLGFLDPPLRSLHPASLWLAAGPSALAGRRRGADPYLSTRAPFLPHASNAPLQNLTARFLGAGYSRFRFDDVATGAHDLRRTSHARGDGVVSSGHRSAARQSDDGTESLGNQRRHRRRHRIGDHRRRVETSPYTQFSRLTPVRFHRGQRRVVRPGWRLSPFNLSRGGTKLSQRSERSKRYRSGPTQPFGGEWDLWGHPLVRIKFGVRWKHRDDELVVRPGSSCPESSSSSASRSGAGSGGTRGTRRCGRRSGPGGARGPWWRRTPRRVHAVHASSRVG